MAINNPQNIKRVRIDLGDGNLVDDAHPLPTTGGGGGGASTHIQAQLDDLATSPVSEDGFADLRLSSGRALHTTLRAPDGSEIDWGGSNNNSALGVYILGSKSGGGMNIAAMEDNPYTGEVGLNVNVMPYGDDIPITLAGETVTIGPPASLTPSAPTSTTVGIASAQAVASNASRKGLVLINLSANRISFGLGADAVLDSGITIIPYGIWQMDSTTFYNGQINAIASAAGSALAVQEFS